MYKLRELARKDIEFINNWRNDPELISFLGAPFRYINVDVDENWFDNYMSNRAHVVRCSIVTESDDKVLGLVTLASIDQLNQSAELHIMIGEKDSRGKGMGTFAVTEMLKHAFNNLNLHRVELSVLSTNKVAQKLYEKCGLVREGTKRKAVYKNGQFVDMHIYAVLREDFKE